MRRPQSHSGSALVIVLAIGLLLAVQIYIVLVYSSGSFKHTERVSAHVRAIFVGESAFQQILARLRTTRWQDRWFKNGADQQADLPLVGGTYSSYVATALTTPEQDADVWIVGRYDGAVANLYYRVMCAENGLDFTSQMYPKFFTFLQDTDPNPNNGPSGLTPSLAMIGQEINQQQTNLSQAVSTLNSLQSVTSLQGIIGALNVQPPGPLLDQTQPINGAPGVPQSGYQDQVVAAAQAAPSPPPPVPTPTPIPDNGLTDPQHLIQAIIGFFNDPALQAILHTSVSPAMTGDLHLSTGTLNNQLSPMFDNYGQTNTVWNKASNIHYSWGFRHWTMYHIPTFISEMGKVMDSLTPAPPPVTDPPTLPTPPPPIAVANRTIINQTLGALQYCCQYRVTTAGTQPQPVPSLPDPASDSHTFNNALQSYINWLDQYGGITP